MTNSSFPLKGKLVELSPFVEADITDQYLSWLNDPVAVRLSNQRFMKHDRNSSLSFLRSFERTPNLFLAIRMQIDGRHVGNMTAYVAPHHGTADMGLLVGERSLWGKGIGLDAWVTLMEYLFSSLNLRKVTGGTLRCNLGMLKIMERSGMHLEGKRERQELVDGVAQDIMYYAKFREN